MPTTAPITRERNQIAGCRRAAKSLRFPPNSEKTTAKSVLKSINSRRTPTCPSVATDMPARRVEPRIFQIVP